MKVQCVAILILVALCSGCATHYVRYEANTDPPANWVYAKGQSRSWQSYYEQKVTQEDIQRGRVELPTLVFESRGHLPFEGKFSDIVIDKSFYKHGFQQGDKIIHGYHNTEKITLRKDYAYKGPEQPNRVHVVVNSEPQGAKVYENGKFVGNTPLEVNYTLRNENYQSGVVNCQPMIAVMDGYLPVEFSAKLPVEDDWKYKNNADLKSSKGMLFILRRDPNDQRPIIVQQGAPQQPGQQTIVIKQDPHSGREWQDGMRALGEVIRPHSKVDPYTTEKNIRALEGYGTLMDLMNR